MILLDKLRSLYRQSMFDDSLLGFFINPSYISRSSLFKIFKRKSALFNGLRIIDIGCGAKPYADLFHDASSYVGVDTNYSGHDHSKEEIDIFYDGKTLPFTEKSFDAVVSFQVLEHVENESLFFKEIDRVLLADGLLMLSVPFCWSEHEQPYDFRRVSSFGAEKLLTANNFDVVEIIKTTNHLQTIIQLLNTYLSMRLKTKSAILNILMICIYSPLLNLMGLIFGKITNNKDLFCDLVIIARKRKSQGIR